MGGKGVVTILFLIAIIGFGLYMSRSGFIAELRSFTSGLTRSSPTSSPTSAAPVYAPQGGGTSELQPPTIYVPSYELPQATNTSAVNPSEIPQGYTASQLSPYFHKIRLGSAYGGYGFSPGQVSLNASFSDSEAIDVSGWLLQARQGGQIVPQAVNLYDPSGLAAEGDIVLRSGDYLTIYTSVASAVGKNLRLNKCIGYLQNTNNFNPPLPGNCPPAVPNRSDISGFTGICQDYLLSLNYCQLPKPNVLLPQSDYGCIAYLQTINYKGCFDKHIGDADFLSHEWRAWGGGTFLDPRHDKLELLDKNGLLVDLNQY